MTILARHAESMLWVGRYLERIEATARCLDCEADFIVHLKAEDAQREWEKILQTLGFLQTLNSDDSSAVGDSVADGSVAGHGDAVGGVGASGVLRSMDNILSVVDFLLSETRNPGSVVSMVYSVRENLRSVRDRIPVELWEESNGLYLRIRDLEPMSRRSQVLHEILLMVRQSCMALSGILHEFMLRDDGHAFIVIGRMLERSIFTVSLMRSCLSDTSSVVDFTRLLRLATSLQAYRRHHGYSHQVSVAVAFLLAAHNLPHSVLSCMTQVEKCLDDLQSTAAAFHKPRRRVGLLRARLEFGAIESELEDGYIRVLDDVAEELNALATEVMLALSPPIIMPAVRSQYLRPGQESPRLGEINQGDHL